MIFKKTIKLIIGTCLLFPLGAYAHLISITATTPFPSTVQTSSTATALYTVQNITSKVTLTVVDKSAFPSGLSIASSTCGTPIGPGQTCQIQLQFVAPSIAQTISTYLKEWAKPSADGVQVPITLTVTGASPQPPVAPPAAVAVGQDFTNNLSLIAASTDGGNTWAVKNFANNSNQSLAAASCTGGSSEDLCVAVGFSTATTIVRSVDGGNTWALADTSAVSSNINFSGVSCISSSLCVAVGEDNNTGIPILIQSTDGAQTWVASPVTLPNPSDSGFFGGVSCTRSGANTVCVASGTDTVSNSPLLAVTINNGASWFTPTIPGLINSGLGVISCAGSGVTSICSATVTEGGSMAVSTDGGNSWRLVTISTPPNTSFFGISCTGSGSSTICVAAGIGGVASNSPVLTVSTDGANTWNTVTIPGFSDTGQYNSVSCTGSGVTAICAAGGSDGATSNSLLATSTDGANTWSVVTAPTIVGGQINTTSCSGNYCLAAGESAGIPALLQSVDGAQTWSVVTVANIPATGVFNGSAALSSTLVAKFPHHIIQPKDVLKKIFQ